MGIIWKYIEGFDLYECSNLGDIRNKKTNKKLRGYMKNYHAVSLYNGFGKKVFYIHRIIAKAFIPTDDYELTVNHIDGDRFNNRVDNLEWMDMSNQLSHYYLSNKKEYNTLNVVLMFDLDGNFLKEFDSLIFAAKFIRRDNYKNISSALSKCLLGKQNTAYGYIWKYPKIISYDGEEWIDIEGGYRLSNYGRLINKFNRLNKPILKAREYYYYSINGNQCLVHRLVAEYFLDKIEGRDIVNHIDGDKLNNCCFNLEYVTSRENSIKYYELKNAKV